MKLLFGLVSAAVAQCQADDPDCFELIWSDWGEWTDCSRATNIRKRYRQCLGDEHNCKGMLEGSQRCQPLQIWSDWSNWSECFGSGYRVKSRDCLAGSPHCKGKLFRPEACSSIWGEWGGWSYCNWFTGKRSRQAPCLSGEPHCRGPLWEQEYCWRSKATAWRAASVTEAHTESDDTPQVAGYNPNIWRS